MVFHWLVHIQHQSFLSWKAKLIKHLLACRNEFDPQWTDVEWSSSNLHITTSRSNVQTNQTWKVFMLSLRITLKCQVGVSKENHCNWTMHLGHALLNMQLEIRSIPFLIHVLIWDSSKSDAIECPKYTHIGCHETHKSQSRCRTRLHLTKWGEIAGYTRDIL